MSDKMIQLELPFPKEMDTIRAKNIIDGYERANKELLLQAYQHLIDSGIVWSMQGSYGRHALRLINEGFCEPNSLPYSFQQYSC